MTGDALDGEPRFEQDLRLGRVVFARGSVLRVAEEVRRLGRRRVMLVADDWPGGPAPAVVDDLGDLLAASGPPVVQHVPAQVADVASSAARSRGCDVVVGLGGGSAIGLAKTVALATGIPVVAVPTTYSGSEMSDIWGITRDGEKMTGRDERVRPAVVIYDPDLVEGLPQRVAATSAMNAIAHAVEALYAPTSGPTVQLLACRAVELLARHAPGADAAEAGPRDARLLLGAHLAGVCLGNAAMGVHHKICHVLGGMQDLDHSGLHAALLPHVVQVLRGNTSRERDLAASLGATDAATGLRDLVRRIGAPESLREVGARPGSFDAVAEAVAAARPPGPRVLSMEDLRNLLLRAYETEPGHA